VAGSATLNPIVLGTISGAGLVSKTKEKQSCVNLHTQHTKRY